MFLTYRYRLLPTKRQHRALEEILESQRQLYNAALEERIDAYRKAGIARSYFDQCRGLTQWRQSDAEASAVPVPLQRATLKRLDEAYQAFFRRIARGAKPGFPRFRGKGRFNSFGFAYISGISLRASRLRFKGMPGSLRVHLHREFPQGVSIRCCSFKRDTKGWSVCFAVTMASPARHEAERVVGVDLGISIFAALSDGGFIPSLRAARQAERRLRVAQRSLARKKRGSAGRRQARAVVARCHAAVSRRRMEHLNQASARLVRDYDIIVIEKLNLKGLISGPVSKDVHDASWATFISMLRYKAERAGARVIEVNSRNTSQDCSVCYTRVSKDWGDRLHKCPQCGLSLDRDLNAARNILNRAGVSPGLPNVAGHCGMRAGKNLSAARQPRDEAPLPPSRYPIFSPRSKAD
jgi:putative transposase